MSSFRCEKCGADIVEGRGGYYITECEHYPLEDNQILHSGIENIEENEMGTREHNVESYLKRCVESVGGLSRKWVSPSHIGVPDQIVIHNSRVWFVEVKTDDGVLSSAQTREHVRLQIEGAQVRVVYGKTGVDEFMEEVLSCK